MKLSASQIEQFNRDGYLLFPELFSQTEIDILKDEADRISQIDDRCVAREGTTGQVKAMFRLHETDGPTASGAYRAAAHSPRVLEPVKQLLNDPDVYIHHTKVNMKAAIEGSAWPWHQDFGSWHLDGIAKPEMLTVMIALDEATEFNGCLHFLPGTHADGRLNPYFDTSTAWKLWAVTPQEVKAYMKEKSQPVAITGKPGMVAIFHCNLLHASGHNLSPDDRTQAYFCFNRVANRPADVEKPRPDFVRSTNWVPIEVGSDAAVLASTG